MKRAAALLFALAAACAVATAQTVLYSLSPQSTIAGGPQFALTVNGGGFSTGTKVYWGNTELSTTFLSGTQLRATVPASFITQPGSVAITARLGNIQSNFLTFDIFTPTPQISNITPDFATAGGPPFQLMIDGSGFVIGSELIWNQATVLPTQFIYNHRIIANIPAALISVPGTATLIVSNPNESTSNSIQFTIRNPPPVLQALLPAEALAGGPSFTLRVLGNSFLSGAVVLWNGNPLPTSFLAQNELQASVAASLIAQPGAASVQVRHPDGGESAVRTYPINSLRITSLSPASTVAGGPAFDLTVTGTGFSGGIQVFWNQFPLESLLLSATTVQTTVPATFITQPGTASITVRHFSGVSSNPLPFTISTTPPQITSLSPASAAAGGPQFTLTVNGSGFASGDAVLWNQTPLASTLVSGTSIQATVPAGLIAQPGTASVAVRNSSGATSNSLPFEVTATPVQITALSPSFAAAGGAQFTLTVTGSGFSSGAEVLWNQSPLASTPLSATSIQAIVPAALIAQAGTASVAVRNPGGATSNSIQFLIEGAPRITSLIPASAAAGGPQFTLTVLGSGFNPASLAGSSVVRWNGAALQTTYISASEVRAVVPPGLIEQPTTASITVDNTGRAVSNAVPFPVTAPLLLTALEPASRAAGGPAFSLAATGTGFVPGTVLRFNGVPIPTSYISQTRLQATVPAALFAAPGIATIVAANPDGAVSGPLPFTILSGPQIQFLSPPSVPAAGRAFSLTVVGSGFASEAVVLWDGTALATEQVSSAQLTAAVPASLIAQPRTVNIAVRNPDESVSLPVPFEITAPLRVTSLAPQAAVAGGPALTLTVDGTGFAPTARVLFGGIQLSTTFVSATRLLASLPAARIAQPGTVEVSVEIPNVAISNTLPFTVQPGLAISALEPVAATAGGAAFTLTVQGTGFTPSSAVRWNGNPLATNFVSDTRLTAAVPALLIGEPGSAAVTVANPDGTVSNTLNFAVRPPLRILNLTPLAVVAGGPPFLLTVDGTGFVSGSSVRWGGTPLATTLAAPDRLTATVPANLTAQPAAVFITVANPDGAVSAGITFTVSPALAITGLDPAAVTAGGGAVTLTISGSGFVSGAVVQFGGVPLPTNFVSGSRLTAGLDPALTAQPGTASIRVVNPDGGISNTLELPVRLPPVPAVSVRAPSGTADPNDSIQVGGSLAGPFPGVIAGRLTVSFEPNAVGAYADDPKNVEFANGSRIFEFTIPANQTQIPAVGLKVGTVAGTVVVTATLLRAGDSAMQPPVTATSRITVGRLAPRIDRACLIRTASGFDAVVIGYSTPRQITSATFRFNATAGANLQTAELTPAGTGDAFTSWYQSSASQSNGLGSLFRLVQPFTVSGPAEAVRDASVVLTNSSGASQTATAVFDATCPNR